MCCLSVCFLFVSVIVVVSVSVYVPQFVYVCWMICVSFWIYVCSFVTWIKCTLTVYRSCFNDKSLEVSEEERGSGKVFRVAAPFWYPQNWP